MFFLSIGLDPRPYARVLGLWLLAAREKRSLDNPQLGCHTGANNVLSGQHLFLPPPFVTIHRGPRRRSRCPHGRAVAFPRYDPRRPATTPLGSIASRAHQRPPLRPDDATPQQRVELRRCAI